MFYCLLKYINVVKCKRKIWQTFIFEIRQQNFPIATWPSQKKSLEKVQKISLPRMPNRKNHNESLHPNTSHIIVAPEKCNETQPIANHDSRARSRFNPALFTAWKLGVRKKLLKFMAFKRRNLWPFFSQRYYGLTLGEMKEWIYFLSNDDSNVHVHSKQKMQQPLFDERWWTNLTIR